MTDDALLDALREGALAVLPVSVSVAAFGLVWGVLAGQAEMSLVEVVLMSGLVFAGSSQFVALDFWTSSGPDPLAAAVAAVAVVNLRMMLLTTTLRPLFGPRLNPRDIAAAGLVADENWALTIARMGRGPTHPGYLVGSGLTMYCVWLAATVSGRMLGGVVPDPAQFGLDFAFTATFLALLLGLWRSVGDLVTWTASGLIAIAVGAVAGPAWGVLAGGLLGSLTGAMLIRLRDRVAA